MFDELIRRWWIVGARGVVSIAMGLALFVAPLETMWILVSAFGIFALADGIFAVGAGLAIGWFAVFLEGVVGMTIGVFTYLFPDAVALWFVALVVAWAVATGFLALVGVVGLGRSGQVATTGQVLLGLYGASSLVFATLFGADPEAGSLTGLLGAYAIVSGALLALLALNLRTWKALVPQHAA